MEQQQQKALVFVADILTSLILATGHDLLMQPPSRCVQRVVAPIICGPKTREYLKHN